MTYAIREVDPADADVCETIERLHRATFANSAPIPDIVDAHWWLAFHGNKAVAFAGLRHSHRWDGCGYLCRAGVLKAHRGQRLQRRLLRVRERKARSLGWKWLFTDTTSNPPSANNLIVAGYRIYEPRAPYAFNHTIYWRKAL